MGFCRGHKKCPGWLGFCSSTDRPQRPSAVASSAGNLLWTANCQQAGADPGSIFGVSSISTREREKRPGGGGSESGSQALGRIAWHGAYPSKAPNVHTDALLAGQQTMLASCCASVLYEYDSQPRTRRVAFHARNLLRHHDISTQTSQSGQTRKRGGGGQRTEAKPPPR